MSTSVWEVPSGLPNNRRNKLSRPLRVSVHDGGPRRPPREITVRNHTAKILCEGHNGATSELDAEGGRFAAAIRDLFDTHMTREWLRKAIWNVRTYPLSGPLLERWLLKLAINNMFDMQVPIGSPDAPPGWPSPELVEMVFGVRPVPREAGAGLFFVVHEHNVGDSFSMSYVERNGTHLAAFTLSYGMFHLGLHFEAREPSNRLIESLPHLGGGRIERPAISMRTGRTNVGIRLLW